MNNRFLLTQSLLSSWNWVFKVESGYEDFLKTLKRERTPPTKAMLDGIKFENLVAAYLDGAPLDEGHEWHKGITEVADTLKNSVLQVKLSKRITIDGVEFVLYGILDALKAGVVYDTKFSKTYKYGKYLDSPQHPMYLELCPEASEFTYIISNGKDVYMETYGRQDTPPIKDEIHLFMKYLDEHRLTDLYCANWRSQY